MTPDQTLVLLDRLRGTTDPRLRALVAGITPGQDTPLQRRLLADLQALAATLPVSPFLPAPPGVLVGPITLGYDPITHAPLGVPLDALTRHTLITGSTGSGKTTISLWLALQARQAGTPLLVIDAKDDANFLATTLPDCIVLHPNVVWPLLLHPPHLTPAQATAVFLLCFARSFWGGEHTKQVLHEALGTYPASIAALQARVQSLSTPKDTYQRRDAIAGVRMRLQRLRDTYPGPCTSTTGLTMEDLAEATVLLPITTLGEPEEFLITFLLHHLYLYRRAHSHRDGLRNLVVMDEGLLVWRKHPASIDQTPLLSLLVGQVREYGIGMLIVSNTLTGLDPVLRANIHTHLALNPSSSAETTEVATTLGLTTEQRAYLEFELTRGHAILRCTDTYRQPLLVQIPPLRFPKTVTAEDWDRALQRTALLTPPAPEEPSTPLPATDEPRLLLPAPASLPPRREPRADDVRVAPNAPAPHKPVATPQVIALNTHEERLLAYLCEHPLTPATTAYNALGLPPQTGTSAKQKLLTLALLREDQIVIRQGRGGTALALRPTPAGYERAGKKPPRGTRGGDSAQHEYLVRELSAHLPGSTLETTLGTKSIDLLVRLDHQHHQLITSITRHAHAITTSGDSHQEAPPVQEGDLLAIEVEVSDPLTTGTANVQKNHEAGIARTLLAVLPKHVTTTIAGLAKRLAPALHQHVLVIDALQLLNDLRATKESGREGGQ